MPERTMHLPSARPTIPPSTKPGTSVEDFNVGEYLIDKTSPIVLAGEMRIDQYGLMFEQVVIYPCDLSDEDYTPRNPDAGRQRLSVRVFPARQPSPIEEDVEYDQDVDMQSQPQMTFNLQEMDMEAQQFDRRPPSPDAMDKSCVPMDDEIAFVAASVEGKVVINVGDVESYSLER